MMSRKMKLIELTEVSVKVYSNIVTNGRSVCQCKILELEVHP